MFTVYSCCQPFRLLQSVLLEPLAGAAIRGLTFTQNEVIQQESLTVMLRPSQSCFPIEFHFSQFAKVTECPALDASCRSTVGQIYFQSVSICGDFGDRCVGIAHAAPSTHYCVTVKTPELIAVPPGVVIAILPVFAPEGTLAVTSVSEFTTTVVALTPPNVTLLVCVRLTPVIVTGVPTFPL